MTTAPNPKEDVAAFPSRRDRPYPSGGCYRDDRPGMSLRDYFAAKAIPAIIEVCRGDTMDGMQQADYFAGRAYEIADAMIRARQESSHGQT